MDAARTARTARVLNRTPAPVQITAEQLVLEARDRSDAAQPPPPKQHITDPQELAAYRLRTRKEFEDKLRMQRMTAGLWLRYGKWEESQKETERARSIYERALDIDYKNPHVWIAYAEMEMRSKFINRARNVWDRVVTLLPRVDTFWYKYTYMEEILGNIAGARIVFERWMQWEPPEQAWLSYVNLELRAGEVERARALYERYVACHPLQASYLRFSRWEERNGQAALARRVYERALDELRADEQDAGLFVAFARFEERCGEVERARAVFKLGLARIGESAAAALSLQLVAFEKQHGSARDVESIIIDKRRGQYELAVAANVTDYDVWFDYARLEESEGDWTRIRGVYDRAVSHAPPIAEKRFWRRYVYMWIHYALFEETVARDFVRARDVLQRALRVVPHSAFTFSKLWLLTAHFEVRRKNLDAMRKVLGRSLGVCPRTKVLRGYIALEAQLGEVGRCRALYEKWVAGWPTQVQAWVAFAELERSLSEDDRAVAVYELAISQPLLDAPEIVWKAFIDFEIQRFELGRARALYRRLLDRSKAAKVWLSYASFEGAVAGDAAGARAAYSSAYEHFRSAGAPGREERLLIVEAWLAFERAVVEDEVAHGGDGSASVPFLTAVQAKVPSRVVRKRELTAADGSSLGWEEYFDYVFPDDEVKPAALRLLELAHKWRSGGGGITAAVLRGPDADSGPVEVLSGQSRRRDDNEGGIEADCGADDDADIDSGARKRARMLPPGDPSAQDEVVDATDPSIAFEMERRVESSLHHEGSAAARDLYCEEDAGDVADRDAVA